MVSGRPACGHPRQYSGWFVDHRTDNGPCTSGHGGSIPAAVALDGSNPVVEVLGDSSQVAAAVGLAGNNLAAAVVACRNRADHNNHRHRRHSGYR